MYFVPGKPGVFGSKAEALAAAEATSTIPAPTPKAIAKPKSQKKEG